jgi:hypothetical protein
LHEWARIRAGGERRMHTDGKSEEQKTTKLTKGYPQRGRSGSSGAIFLQQSTPEITVPPASRWRALTHTGAKICP